MMIERGSVTVHVRVGIMGGVDLGGTHTPRSEHAQFVASCVVQQPSN